jgi:hypothetical protein
MRSNCNEMLVELIQAMQENTEELAYASPNKSIDLLIARNEILKSICSLQSEIIAKYEEKEAA